MRFGHYRRRFIVAFALIPVLSGCATAGAQSTSREPRSGGFNLYSPEQDVQLGRQAARQVEQQLPMIRSGQADAYVQEIVDRLAEHAGGPGFRYQAQVVNAAEINAFLASASRTPVPQPLAYLVDDVSRKFGTIRAGAAESFLRSDDESALTELVHHPKASTLRLRRIAPTVSCARCRWRCSTTESASSSSASRWP